MDQLSTPEQRSLPNATPVLVLGILSIVLCWCWGLGLVTGIIAMVMAAKDRKLLASQPEAFTTGSLKNLNAGRICAIIGIVLSVLYIVYIIVLVSILGVDALSDPKLLMEKMQQMQAK